MKTLSEQLSALSAHTARLADVIAAAEDRDRERLQAQHAELQAGFASGRQRIADTAAATQSWWSQARDSAEKWFSDTRARNTERREEHDRKRAEHRADEAEADAADAIDFAIYALDQAEYAIIQASLARADADALAD